MQIKFILYIYTYLYILFLKFFLLLKRQVNITWYIPREMFSYWSNVKKNFESIANLVKYKYEWKGFKILEFFQWKKKKKKFRNSYHYFEARKAWTQRKKLSSALRGGCISKGATISKREGKFGLSVGQFHRAVNNDISEGMVGYRNFGSPLDWGNDRTRHWTALSLSPSPPDLSLLSPSLLAFTYTNWSISRLIRFNRQNCLFNIEYFCFHGKNNRIVKLTAGNDIIFNRTYGIFVKIVERFNE